MNFGNCGLIGQYKGYELTLSEKPTQFFLWIFPKPPIYNVKMDALRPLYFLDRKGRRLTPRRKYESDLASIPPPFDRVWSPSEFRLSGIIHDDCCKNGGLYQILDDGNQVFVSMTRKEADELIEDMAQVECNLLGKGNFYQWITKHCIYFGVRIGAFFGVGTQRDKQPSSKIDVSKVMPTIS